MKNSNILNISKDDKNKKLTRINLLHFKFIIKIKNPFTALNCKAVCGH